MNHQEFQESEEPKPYQTLKELLDPVFNVLRKERFDRLLEHCLKYLGKPYLQWERNEIFCLSKEYPHEPLDVINIYKNPGNQQLKIPPHWHYVGFGLSDLYGYGYLRTIDYNYQVSLPPIYPVIHQTLTHQQQSSNGFGFELTFRVTFESNEELTESTTPPLWPMTLMQKLAYYAMQTQTIIRPRDHFSWAGSLDEDESRLDHILMSFDPELAELSTSAGNVSFIQIVGVCKDEHRKAEEWNAQGIMDLMKKHEATGGEYLVTDMRRGESLFELNPTTLEIVEKGIEKTGSTMVMLTTKHRWSSSPIILSKIQDEAVVVNNSQVETSEELDYYPRCASRMSSESEMAMNIDTYQDDDSIVLKNSDLNSDDYFLKKVYLLIDKETASFIPLIMKRVLYFRRPFTFKTVSNLYKTTFIPSGYVGKSMVTLENKFARDGEWLQILVTEMMREKLCNVFDKKDNELTSGTYDFLDYNLHIIVVNEVPETTPHVNLLEVDEDL